MRTRMMLSHQKTPGYYKEVQNRKRKKKVIVIRTVIAVLCFFTLLFLYKNILPKSIQPDGLFSASLPETVLELPQLYSSSAVLTERSSGLTIAAKSAGERIYPASLTKIMTAVLAVENTENLDSVIAIPPNIFAGLYEEQASMAGFSPGEKVRYRDLLYGILLPSGAECCLAYAIQISGSEEVFVDLMNQKAQTLGMKNTHFCNSTGLQNRNHYTTVEDIAILVRYALNNSDFRDAFTSSTYNVQPSGKHPQGFTLYSTMFKELADTVIPGGEILGGKTGYTDEAGLCLASLAVIDEKEYILVTANAKGTHQTEPFHILDAVHVYSQLGKTE